MPTRKQRRRREKGRRHEYEIVYVDDEGNEVEVADEERELRASKNGRVEQRQERRPRIDPPSWRRIGKRGLIFAPLMFVTVMLLDTRNELGLVQELVQTLLLLAVFLPFSYLMDSFMYRRHAKRAGGGAGKR